MLLHSLWLSGPSFDGERSTNKIIIKKGIKASVGFKNKWKSIQLQKIPSSEFMAWATPWTCLWANKCALNDEQPYFRSTISTANTQPKLMNVFYKLEMVWPINNLKGRSSTDNNDCKYIYFKLYSFLNADVSLFLWFWFLSWIHQVKAEKWIFENEYKTKKMRKSSQKLLELDDAQ